MHRRSFVILLFMIGLVVASAGCRNDQSAPTSSTTSSPGKQWTCFTNANMVNGLVVRGNEVWWATSGGVVKLNPDDGSHVKYTTLDGLPTNAVLAVALDKKNNLWFGTPSGVVCYDNKTWHTYTTNDGLADNYVSVIAVDGDNRVWCGGVVVLPSTSSALPPSPKGVSCFDGKRWKIFTEQDGLPNNGVLTMAVDYNGRICLGTNNGISRYDGKEWRKLPSQERPSSNYVQALAGDLKGNLWSITESSLSVYDGDSWHFVSTHNNPVWNPSDDLRHPVIAIDRSGNLWTNVARQGDESAPNSAMISPGYNLHSGVSCFDGKTWQTFTTTDGLPSNVVRAITSDGQGTLWFGTDKGICSYDGNSWRTYSTHDLSGFSSLIESVAEDQLGNLWFGTGGSSVLRYDGKDWQNFTVKDGLASNWTSCLATDRNGNLWVAGDGVSLYDGKAWRKFPKIGLGNDQYVGAMAISPDGEVWIASSSGIYRYAKGTWQLCNPPFEIGYDFGKAMAFDSRGKLWVAGNLGVGCYDGKDWQSYPVEKVFPSIINIVFDKEDRLYLASYWGLFVFDGKSWQRFAMADGSTEVSILYFYLDKDGNKWFSTPDNVSRYDGTDWQYFDVSNGLAGNSASVIFQDSHGNYWFGTGGGISRFTP